VSGPLVVGRILSSEPEPQKNGKTIRWCSVDVGEDEPRGIVCGAPNAETGALVVVSLPGAVLPGGFAIAARKTYGHVSDGMICSERELGLGEGHDGILVLDDSELPGAVPGAPAAELLGLADEVIELAVTPDRGYCLSMRGVAREIAGALGVEFEDPYRPVMRPAGNPLPATAGIDVVLADPRCARFAMVALPGIDGSVPSPAWLRSRLTLAGFRPISLVVDVTNYVLVELGQPTHAYDLDTLTGPITVRAARPGERLRTLDGTDRALDAADLLITDATGPIGLAGVMGGESTEISATTTRILVESASFDPVSIARSVRRHKLPSEASRRFERGVDPALASAAAERVAHLLLSAGATGQPGAGWFQIGMTGDAVRAATPIELPAQLPARLLGRPVTDAEVVAALEEVGCSVAGVATLTVAPPTWRPDLTDPHDLVEEVARVVGYDTIPTRVPTAPPGPGLTKAQQRRRSVVAGLVGAGYVESPSYPFISAGVLDTLRIAAGDDRRRLVRVSNPIAGTEPFLRTTLLPGLLAVARRNLGRGADDGQGLALADVGPVVLGPVDGSPLHAPRPPVDARPDDLTVKELQAALPAQPLHLAVVLTGDREPAGWSGSGRAVGWADAVAAVEIVAAAVGVEVRTSAATLEPWHPGRCAAVWAGPVLLGHAGELHPAICRALDLPERTVAAEIDLDALLAAAPDAQVPASPSAFPPAKVDVAVVVVAEVPAADVEAALRSGAGELLESLRLFDIYTGPQVPPGHRSLAYALRLRAADRTLADAEVQAAVAGAVAAAGVAVGAVLRS
jgi:phenylalanyl-tRNA synthetase beta chain